MAVILTWAGLAASACTATQTPTPSAPPIGTPGPPPIAEIAEETFHDPELLVTLFFNQWYSTAGYLAMLHPDYPDRRATAVAMSEPNRGGQIDRFSLKVRLAEPLPDAAGRMVVLVGACYRDSRAQTWVEIGRRVTLERDEWRRWLIRLVEDDPSVAHSC